MYSLQSVQNLWSTWTSCLQGTTTDHIELLMAFYITSLPPLSSIIKSRRLTFYGHLAWMDEIADASQAVFEPPPENWRRPPVRLRTTWMEQVYCLWQTVGPPVVISMLQHVGNCCCYYWQTHTHPFNGPFSGTTRVSRHQKGKTNLDFTEARDSAWQWHQLGHVQVCT